MKWYEAFKLYVKGQNMESETTHNIRHSIIADGILLSNGFKYVSYGGGCSGENCNTSYII